MQMRGNSGGVDSLQLLGVESNFPRRLEKVSPIFAECSFTRIAKGSADGAEPGALLVDNVPQFIIFLLLAPSCPTITWIIRCDVANTNHREPHRKLSGRILSPFSYRLLAKTCIERYLDEKRRTPLVKAEITRSKFE